MRVRHYDEWVRSVGSVVGGFEYYLGKYCSALCLSSIRYTIAAINRDQ